MAAQRKPGWWYPYIFVGLFVVVVGVNMIMAWFATSTFTGLQTDDAYNKGLAYNQNLAMAKVQAELGWTVDTRAEPLGGHRAALAVSYRDRSGRPVEGLEVRAKLVRPTAKGLDREAVLTAAAAGSYGATVELPADGVWDVEVVAVGKDVSYQSIKRVVLK